MPLHVSHPSSLGSEGPQASIHHLHCENTIDMIMVVNAPALVDDDDDDDDDDDSLIS